MSNNKCLICANTSFEGLLHLEQFPILFGAIPLKHKDKVKKYPLTVAICDRCSLIQQVNLLPGSVLDEVYRADYYSCPAPTGNQVGTRVIDEFYAFFGKNIADRRGRVLEIGCFDGYLLTKLQKDHWDVYGCDPAGQTSIAIQNLGADRIVNDFFTKDTYPGHYFDVVIFRHLLEHLYDLHSFLDSVLLLLKDDGCIFIEVPNIDATLRYGGFGSFFHQHISHFSMETLQLLLSQHHLTIERSDETHVLHVKAVKSKSRQPLREANRSVVTNSKKREFLERYRAIEKEIARIFTDPKNKKIAIFGASAIATTITHMIDESGRQKIGGIFDNDSTKQGKFIEGIDVPISSPEKIKADRYDAFIIGSYIFIDEIFTQLLKLGVDQYKIITLAQEALAP